MTIGSRSRQGNLGACGVGIRRICRLALIERFLCRAIFSSPCFGPQPEFAPEYPLRASSDDPNDTGRQEATDERNDWRRDAGDMKAARNAKGEQQP